MKTIFRLSYVNLIIFILISCGGKNDEGQPRKIT
ncbi:uncharacterized protein METZ01_LOCUS199467, partial [marine metagenome]